jgi:holo-[acyl-carrier protein] synthase
VTEPGLLLGLDLTEVDRIAGVLERHGERFLERVFRPGEIRTARRHPRAFAEHVAGRFAAKEAAMKALGVGIGEVDFRDLEVVSLESGEPLLAVHGRAALVAETRGVVRWLVTLSHTDHLAQAVVVALADASSDVGTP